MPAYEKKFQFHLDRKWIKSMPSETPQYCTVEYLVDVFTNRVFISISKVGFTPVQLNYISWHPILMNEMRNAAIDNYNTTRKETELFFIDEA